MCANAANEVNYSGEGCATAQGAFARTLNRGAVRERIAERDAKLDYVRASFGGGDHDFGARFE